MVQKMKYFPILLAVFLSVTCVYAQEKSESTKNSGLEELRAGLQTRDDVIESLWKFIVKTVLNENVSKEKKIEMVKQFMTDFPDNNKYLKEADLILFELKDGSTDPEHVLNRKSYRTKTEWFALSFAGGNFGFGGGFTFVTIRWENFFWEVARIQATGDNKISDDLDRVAANVKTMIGIPFFLDKTNRHEIRVSSGFSGGLTSKYPRVWDEDSSSDYVSLINIPLDISYVFHVKRNFAFQFGLVVDFPVWFDSKYVPSVNGYIGFRL